MELRLIGHDYKYAVEQSLLTLFPGNKPEYPEKYGKIYHRHLRTNKSSTQGEATSKALFKQFL